MHESPRFLERALTEGNMTPMPKEVLLSLIVKLRNRQMSNKAGLGSQAMARRPQGPGLATGPGAGSGGVRMLG